jgi:hypothetical protein
VRDREGVFTAASRRPCRADTTVADSNLADLTHADPINAERRWAGPLADEALAEVWKVELPKLGIKSKIKKANATKSLRARRARVSSHLFLGGEGRARRHLTRTALTGLFWV